MFEKLKVWRSWVSWQRSLFLKLVRGEKMNWLTAIQQLLTIVNRFLTMAGFPVVKPEKPEVNPIEPTPTPTEPSDSPNPAPQPSIPNPSVNDKTEENPYDALIDDDSQAKEEIPMPGRARPLKRIRWWRL